MTAIAPFDAAEGPHPRAAATTGTSGTSGGGRLVVLIPAPWYRVVWICVLVLHAYCGAHLISMALLYWYMDHPYMVYFADLLAPKPSRHFTVIGCAFFVVGFVHVGCFLEMLALSCFHRQLIMTPTDETIRPRVPPVPTASTIVTPVVHFDSSFSPARPSPPPPPLSPRDRSGRLSSGSARQAVQLTASFVQSAWDSTLSRNGFFGIESDRFEAVFAAREVIEVAFQTYQAYRTSQMIATSWVNAIFVALVFLNCVTTPILQHFLHAQLPLSRLCCITADLFLNVGTNMVIPWLVFSSYYAAYDPTMYSFDLAQLYDDVWFTNLVLENRLLFALSQIDFLSKFIPHGTILFCLVSCKSLIQKKKNTPGKKKKKTPSPVQSGQARVEEYTIFSPRRPAVAAASSRATRLGSLTRRSTEAVAVIAHHSRVLGWKTNAVHGLFLIWGVALLVVHLHASHRGDVSELPGCKQSIRPWFTTNTACATYEYNCYRLRDSLPVTEALQRIDSMALVSLIFSHCDNLVVPHAVRDFTNLLSLELYNVTLTEWSTSAAISASIHTSLVALMLIHVNMTSLPDGILGELPASLTDIEIAYSNLTTLPHDLHKRWHPMAVLYFEFSDVHVFPDTLLQLEIYDLSLIGNHLETIPQLGLLPFEYYFLSLSRNPIKELPEEITGGAVFNFLGLEHTALTRLPPWVDDRAVVTDVVYLDGSQFCQRQSGPLSTSSSSVPATCGERDTRGDGRYPLSIMAPRRIP